MKVITEAIIRAELKATKPEVYYIPEGKLLSPAAREYLNQMQVDIDFERNRGAREAAAPKPAAVAASRPAPAAGASIVRGIGGRSIAVGGAVSIVRRLPVSVGSYVREGDLIAECAVSSYDSRLESLQASYSSKEKEYLEQERKGGSLFLTDRHLQWYDAYRKVQTTGEEAQRLRQDLRLEAWKAGVTLGTDDTLPEGCEDETLTALRGQLDEAARAQVEAEKAFDKLKLLNISEEAITYLEKKEELRKEMDDLAAQITALRILKERSAAIRAPHDAYVTSLELKAGDTIGADTILLMLTAPPLA